MKKIITVTVSLLLIVAFTATAFAATSLGELTNNVSTTFGGGVYRPSAKVTVTVSTDTQGLAYCASSQHSGASTNQTAGRQFATLSNSPQIMYAPSETTAGPKACSSTSPPALPTGVTWVSQ